ncbi:MAG: hypothetical protein ABH864_05645 [archaeon]
MRFDDYDWVGVGLVSQGVSWTHAKPFCALLEDSKWGFGGNNFLYTGPVAQAKLLLEFLERERLVVRSPRPWALGDADEREGRRWRPHPRLGFDFYEAARGLKRYEQGVPECVAG